MTRVGDTRRIPVASGAGDAGWDYGDSFEVVASAADSRSAEQWARAALDEALAPLRPLVLFIHRRVLGFHLGPTDSPDFILGWRVELRDHDTMRLSADGQRMRGVIVGRRSSPERMELQTLLFYNQRRAAVIWLIVGPLHRTVARNLLHKTATTGSHAT